MSEINRSPSAQAWTGEPPARQAIQARLRQVMPGLASQFRPQASLSECGGDSIDLVELLCTAESDYGVRLTVDEVAALKTVGDFIGLIDQRATKRPPSPRA